MIQCIHSTAAAPSVSHETSARLRAAVVGLAPVVLCFGFAYHPYVANGTDEAALAEAATEDTTRWGIAHLAIGVGYGLAVLAFIAVRRYLRDAGEERWSVIALPLLVFGSTLFIPLTGMEFALLAAAETGGDVEAVQEELMPWFIPLVLGGALCFALGAVSLATAIVRRRVLSSVLTWVSASGLVVMAAARFVPLGAAQIVLGIAAVPALWPLAYAMWSPRRSALSADLSRSAGELQ
jgi:hypothetical protein